MLLRPWGTESTRDYEAHPYLRPEHRVKYIVFILLYLFEVALLTFIRETKVTMQIYKGINL